MTIPLEKILVVDDEESIRLSLEYILTSKGYSVTLAESGEEAIRLAKASPPELIILDLCMSGIGGLEVCRILRSWYAGPILVLSVLIREEEKIEALDNGADDYITKPFSIGELLARVRALLRRMSAGAVVPKSMSYGSLIVDFINRQVFLAGSELKLTHTEYEILAMLVRHADCVVTNRQLLEFIWGPEYKYKEDLQNLRVHVSHLRGKLEPDPRGQLFIRNEHRVGYRFLTEPQEE